jgi:hypothetical protein
MHAFPDLFNTIGFGTRKSDGDNDDDDIIIIVYTISWTVSELFSYYCNIRCVHLIVEPGYPSV